MGVLMAIGLFTSRVVLRSLGFENLGIYNVVGSVVSLFAIVTQALTTAISRYVTYSLGENKPDSLHRVFSTSVIIVAILSAIVLLLGETLGLAYVRHLAVIPAEKVVSAVWVLHASLAVMVINLFSDRICLFQIVCHNDTTYVFMTHNYICPVWEGFTY